MLLIVKLTKNNMEWKANIERLTRSNRNYRQVLHTTIIGENGGMQLVVMSLKPGENIGEEVRPQTAQFIRVESGLGMARISGRLHCIKDGDAVIIPAGKRHNIFNTSRTRDLKFYTIYTPPEHPRNKLEKEKKM